MKKNYYIAIALTLAACTKAPVPQVQEGPACNPVPVTVTASIDVPDTKMSYTPDGNVLKSSWAKGDKISLIAYNHDYKMVTNDILTAESAGASVRFSGTFSNPSGDVSGVRLVYPALTGSPAASPLEVNNNYNTTGPFSIDAGLLKLASDRQFVQTHNGTYTENGLQNLPYYTLMVASPDRDAVRSGSFTASFSHLTYIIKATLTMPATNPAGDYDYWVTKAELWGKETSPGVFPTLKYYGTAGFFNGSFNTGQATRLRTSFGGIKDDGTPNGFQIERNGTLVVYFVGGFNVQEEAYRLLQGGGYDIKVYFTDRTEPLTATFPVTANPYFQIAVGKMYRFAATLSL